MQFGKIAFFRRTVESKLLAHWEKLISGAQHGHEATRQAQVILIAADKFKLGVTNDDLSLKWSSR
jgi:hypothetical protein